MYFVVILLALFTNNVQCKTITECVEKITEEITESTETLLNSYENNVGVSIEREKSEKIQLNSWAENFQLAQVNLTSTYRVQMMRHRDYNFGNNFNPQMEKDKFSEVLKRLMTLKLRAMGELFMLLTDSAATFEDCLKLCLSGYLSDVRSLMGTLNWCYSGIGSDEN